MLKGLTTKFFAVTLLFCGIFTRAFSLEVSAIKTEGDGEATITFCKTLKIENVALDKNSAVKTVVFEKDDGKFENIALLNKTIADKIVSCFEGVCDIKTACNSVSYTLLSARKAKDNNLVIAKVAFDKDINAVFLVSSFQKKNKIIYRVKMPQDLKFLSSKYKKNFRNWLIKETKDLL